MVCCIHGIHTLKKKSYNRTRITSFYNNNFIITFSMINHPSFNICCTPSVRFKIFFICSGFGDFYTAKRNGGGYGRGEAIFVSAKKYEEDKFWRWWWRHRRAELHEETSSAQASPCQGFYQILLELQWILAFNRSNRSSRFKAAMNKMRLLDFR